jgi:hypothetical protein
MSALPPIADIRQPIEHVCFVPIADLLTSGFVVGVHGQYCGVRAAIAYQRVSLGFIVEDTGDDVIFQRLMNHR